MIPQIARREEMLQKFVNNHFLGKCSPIQPMLGDAGLRSYYRVLCDGKSYIVMDCPPDYCSVQPFINIAHYLRSTNFSAPEIIAENLEHGFLILEDFGKLSVKKYLSQSPELPSKERKRIYHLIIDLLVLLQQQKPPADLKVFDNDLLCSELDIYIEWYIPYAYKKKLNTDQLEEFTRIWYDILGKQKNMSFGVVLRDYHVENMMYLKHHSGVNQLGLLDFQDALMGSQVYDLVSVLEDARFEVPRDEALEYIKYFAQEKNLDIEELLLNYHILGAQRNSRILGVFARKAVRDHDDAYLRYIPLVLKYLEQDLSHSALAPLKIWLDKLL